MPRRVLTLEAGSRFWFEGEVWESDTFLGDQARLRRTARQGYLPFFSSHSVISGPIAGGQTLRAAMAWLGSSG